MTKTRSTYARWVYTLLLMIISYRWHAHALFSQLGDVVIEYTAKDLVYAWLKQVGFFHYISVSAVAKYLLDAMLLLLPIAGLIFPENVSVARFSFFNFSIYLLYFNASTGHHYHGLIGMWLLLLTISFQGKKHLMLMEAARYYLCFIFVSAACWKLLRGAVFDVNHMLAVLQSQHAQLLVEQPSSFHAVFLRWLLQLSPIVAQILFIAATCTQLSFIVGFFTRSYDKMLALLMLLFVATNLLTMGIVSTELLVLLPLLLA